MTDRKPNLETVDLMEECNGCLFGLMLSLTDLNYRITNRQLPGCSIFADCY